MEVNAALHPACIRSVHILQHIIAQVTVADYKEIQVFL
jgi:hypothetical protein